MTTKTKPPKKVTNGEFYDYERKSWMVQCGDTAVAIRKLDKDGEPVPPPNDYSK